MNQAEYITYVSRFQDVDYYSNDNGFIVWRKGTGNNTELLHIKTYVPGQGTGRQLVLRMLAMLRYAKPYCTVFGFTRSCNLNSQKFYEALGFELSEVKGVYADGTAIVFSQTYEKLLEINNVS